MIIRYNEEECMNAAKVSFPFYAENNSETFNFCESADLSIASY